MSNTVISDVEKSVQFVVGLGEKAEALVQKLEKALPANLQTEIVQFISDVESFVANCSTATNQDGLNLSADSAAYASFLTMKSAVLTLAVQLEAALKAL